MAYKVGFCPCCDHQIMVQDTNGRWNSFRPNFRQADLIFSTGQKVRTILCKGCLDETDLQKFVDSILHKDSEACDEGVKNLIQSLGTPVRMELAVKAKQGVRLGN